MDILYYCSKCGKAVYEKYGSGKFCSRKCANSRTFSKETNEKRSRSVKAYFERCPEARERSSITMQKLNALQYNRNLELHTIKEKKYCRECNKRISSNNKTGFCKQHINLSKSWRKNLSDKMKENLQKGKCKSWQSRNISSYAERFWIKVLNNNHIDYLREFKVDIDKNKRYFLDFLIEKNGKKIDLEIDGKQHKYAERVEHDISRDDTLSNLGYCVYRVDWNEINSEQGKLKMKSKIEDFLQWLQKQ